MMQKSGQEPKRVLENRFYRWTQWGLQNFLRKEVGDMKKQIQKLLSMVLALVMVAGMVPVNTVTAIAAPPSVPAERSISIYYGRAQLAQLANADALLYAYDRIAAGVAESAKTIAIHNGGTYLTRDEFLVVLDAYIRDYADHFWLGNRWNYTSTGGDQVVSVIPSYILSGSELTAAKAAFYAAAAEILSGISDSMSDYEKELYIHDAMAQRIVYEEGTHAHNAYGALVIGEAVCEGYAEAFQYLLQQVGIQSFLMTGVSTVPRTDTSVGHTWNAVKIDGKFYHVDLTWDDQAKELFHAYFNVSDARILEDHAIYSAGYPLPVCNSQAAFYFTGKDTLLTTYTAASVGKLLKDNHGKVHMYLPTGDVETFLEWLITNAYDIAAAAGVTGYYSYGYTYLGREVVLYIPELQNCAHDYKALVTPPTCTDGGYTTYICKLCGDAYNDDETAALGHDYDDGVVTTAPTCTEAGVKTFTCHNCDDRYTESVAAKGHNYVSVVTAPTCTAKGYTTHTCSACGAKYVDSYVNATGHTPNIPAATETEDQVCVICHTVLASKTGHICANHLTLHKANSATCTAAGNVQYYGCSCGKFYEDAAATKMLATVVIPALGHDPVAVPGYAATCTAQGKTDGSRCARCSTVLVKQTTIPALGHAEVTDAAVAATCTSTGLTEGKHCERCSAVLIAQSVINKLPHTEEEIPAVAATCTATGLTAGVRCSACGKTIAAQTTVAALGHSEKEIPAVAPTCTSIGLTAGRKCTRCGITTLKQTTVPATGHAWSGGSCSNCGSACDHSYDEHGVCDVCGSGCTHDYTTTVTAPTCTAQGYTTYTCVRCGNTYNGDYQNILGHNWEDATCTDPKACSRCGITEGSPNGHNYKAAVTAPTCTAQGYTTHICTGCGDRYTDSYTPETDHSYGQWQTVKAATCTADGEKKQSCKHCDSVRTENIPASGHSWTVDGTTMICTECGEKTQSGYQIVLDAASVAGATHAWVDGDPYSIINNGDKAIVNVPHTDATNLVIYTYNDPDAQDLHTQYPTGMRVWVLAYQNDSYTATYVPEFDDLLQYSGSSIRITGKKGIRMITSIAKDKKAALTGKGLAGYTLMEYGTVLCFASEIPEGEGLVLGSSYARSNYAYKKGVADPVFASTKDLIQYTNVLVGFSLDQCKDDIAMRPYIILKNAQGEEITLYGGTIYRSIGYIAYQNRSVFQPKTASYNYVWEIIHHVYGNKYDADYKG